MSWFSRERLLLTLSVVTGCVCLSLYTQHLWCEWVPILRGQSILAPRPKTPIAQDFPLHWTASYLALAGESETVYDVPRFKAAEKDLTGLGGHPWPYPPTALLIDL